MRIGILGGTFDPVHFGHLRVAEEVGEGLALETVYLVPAAAPPHKDRKPVSPFPHRLAMTRLAAEESPLLEVQDLEGRRQGLSYSIETLKAFHRLFGSNLEIFFIVGVDAFLEIDTWREYHRLFDYAHFVVIQRPGFQSEAVEPFLLSLQAGFRKEKTGNGFIHPSGNTLICTMSTLMEISSTSIRARIARGASVRFLLPDRVRTYIMEQGLYKSHENIGQSTSMS